MSQVTETKSDPHPPAGVDAGTGPPASSGSAGSPGETRAALGLNRGDRRVVPVLIAVALLLMLVHWYRLTQYRPQPIRVLHPEGYTFQVEINSATWVEWMQLDGVGEVLARRIVEDRRQRGPFASIDEVQRVSGIGPKTLATLRPHLTIKRDADGVAR